jgi:hypothetical protein
MSLSGSANGNRFQVRYSEKFGQIGEPGNTILGANFFGSLSVSVADRNEVSYSTLTKDSNLVFAPETCAYDANR